MLRGRGGSFVSPVNPKRNSSGTVSDFKRPCLFLVVIVKVSCHRSFFELAGKSFPCNDLLFTLLPLKLWGQGGSFRDAVLGKKHYIQHLLSLYGAGALMQLPSQFPTWLCSF